MRKQNKEDRQQGNARAEAATPEKLSADQEEKVKGGLASSAPTQDGRLAAN